MRRISVECPLLSKDRKLRFSQSLSGGCERKKEKLEPQPGFEAQFYDFPDPNLVSIPNEISQLQIFTVNNQQALSK
jgi:hypothetical protein